MSDLPRLADVATVTMGTSPKGTSYNNDGEGLPLLNGPTEFGPSHPLCTLFTTQSKKECQTGDLIFCVRGSTTGRMNWADRVYSLGRGVCSIRGETQLDTKYLKYCIQCHLDALLMLAGGATMPNLTQDTIKSFTIPFPKTRRKIASILSAYDDLIENNTRRIAILEEMAQAIYREWFVNFRFPGHENVKLVDSDLGPIPEGWEATTVGDLAIHERRSVKPQEVDPGTPYIGLEHIPRKSITLNEWGFAADIESTKHRFYEGEILFGKIRPYFHKVIVAPFDGICSSDAIVIAAREEKFFPAILSCVSSVPFVDHATQTSQGTKMPRANWDVLTKYSLPLPPDELLSDYNEVVNNILASLKTLMLKNRSLRNTRDLLLPKLISGKLDVEDLDVDVGLTTEALEEATA